jgi:hypothetical protein
VLRFDSRSRQCCRSGASGEPAAGDQHILPKTASPADFRENDCETRMRKLDQSPAEGVERLAEKNAAIDYCADQYEKDKTIARLVRECAKYEEQPVIKQQFVAECMLAAYTYANALYFLKAEYGK